ncbi:MAG TPA: hypothetical protein VKB93_12415 [Thermoanaerobaculia bacterium]|nr:hypothetical protein [Thermoanaerobaculia bacterium]
MREAALVALLFAAVTAAGEVYDRISIQQLPVLGAPKPGGYYEYRFAVRNETVEAHKVRIDIKSMTVVRTPGETHTSREFTVRPLSLETVRIPQYVSSQMYGPSEGRVTIDGSEQREPLSIARTSGTDSGLLPFVLVGRNVPQDVVMILLPGPPTGIAVRADLPAAEWSDQWIQYGQYDGVLLTTEDWTQLPPAVRSALLRWTAAGGTLTFLGMPGPLPVVMRQAVEAQNVAAWHSGFGTIAVLESQTEFPVPAVEELRTMWRRGKVNPETGQRMDDVLPILDKTAIPIGSMFSVLVLFAVAGGPASLILLARKEKRVWIFGTLPLLAIVTTVTVVGALILNEGFARIQRTTTVTMLDEQHGEAATIGWIGFYATFPPNGEVRFDYDSEVQPLFPTKDARTDWTDGQRFLSGWVGSRVPSHFTLRKSEPRRERVPIRIQGGRVYALNGLGVPITKLEVALADGSVFEAQQLAPGKEVTLRRNGTIPGAWKDPALLPGASTTWYSLASRVSNESREYLRPGTYIAVLDKSPFVEQALEDPSRVTTQAVVIGTMKRMPNAS